MYCGSGTVALTVNKWHHTSSVG